MRSANYGNGMEDPEVVAAIVAGDPAGLAEAYDRYAVPLYAYCCSMLPEPADAADAVQDTFLIAAARLRGLPDPGKLRPWLYAVARNESLRRLRAAHPTAALDEADELASESASQAERADLLQLVRRAIAGLNSGDRDVIELSLGHELEGDDLADALGVSRNHAHALLSRARNQLERSLGALIVARTGREACAELGAMLTDWDGQLTVLLRKRISRHIEHCDTCGERKRRELTPALFAGAIPLVAVLPGFRDQLLRMMADRTPAGMAHRLGVANRAGPFGPAGFPKPISSAVASPWHRALHRSRAMVHHAHVLVASAATTVVVGGAIAAVVIGGTHSPSAAGAETTHGAGNGTVGASAAHGGPSARTGGGLAPSVPGPGGATSSAPPGTSATSGSATSGTATSGSATSGSGSSAPGSSPSVAATGPASASSSAPAVTPGTVAVSPQTLDLAVVNGTATGDLTITAHGGPVSYSIAVGSSLAGKLAVSPASGSLASGQSVTVTVTSTSLLSLDGKLTVNPGGQGVTVLLSVGL
jgi:RNA polymerase sigma factor (sigma-70 family)